MKKIDQNKDILKRNSIINKRKVRTILIKLVNTVSVTRVYWGKFKAADHFAVGILGCLEC